MNQRLSILTPEPPDLKQLCHDTWDKQSTIWPGYVDGDDFHRAAINKTEEAVMRSRLKAGHMSLVDLGCGSGGFLFQIRDPHKWSRLAGVDYCEPAIKKARNRDVNGFPKIQFVPSDLETLAVTGQATSLGQFEIAVSTFVLDEIDDIDAFFRTSRSLLEPTGILICAMLDEARERTRHALNPFVDSTGAERIIIKQTKTDRYGVDVEYYRIIRPRGRPIRSAEEAGLVCRSDQTFSPSDLNSRPDGPSLRLLIFAQPLLM